MSGFLEVQPSLLYFKLFVITHTDSSNALAYKNLITITTKDRSESRARTVPPIKLTTGTSFSYDWGQMESSIATEHASSSISRKVKYHMYMVLSKGPLNEARTRPLSYLINIHYYSKCCQMWTCTRHFIGVRTKAHPLNLFWINPFSQPVPKEVPMLQFTKH